jgi:hypothetical protein
MNNLIPIFVTASMDSIIHFMPLFAQMDSPNWVIVIFGLWPFHISSALGISRNDLVGYGSTAVIIQSALLLLLIAFAPVVSRSGKILRWLKVCYLFLGYPLVMLATNLIPAITTGRIPILQ